MKLPRSILNAISLLTAVSTFLFYLYLGRVRPSIRNEFYSFQFSNHGDYYYVSLNDCIWLFAGCVVTLVAAGAAAHLERRASQ